MSAMERQTVINGVRRISGLGGLLPTNDRELLKFAADMLEADGKEMAEKTVARETFSHWIDETDIGDAYLLYRCANCGKESPTEWRFKYCPNCGARMLEP